MMTDPQLARRATPERGDPHPAAAHDAGEQQDCAGTKPNRKRLGLYRKYDVRRTDGSDGHDGKHYQCCYFVLDLTHDPHALPALAAYANSCEADYPMLAHDLRGVVEGNPLMPYKTQIERPELALPAHQERTEPMEFPNWPPLSGVEITDLLKSVPAGPFREKALHALHAHDGLRGVFTDSELTRAGQNWTDDLPRAPRPDFWRCLTCGCLWRDNHDETVSLASDKQTSCAECEMKGTLTTCEPLYRAAPARAAEWQPLDADNLPKGKVLLTNNINARDAFGGMSNVWLGYAIRASNSEQGIVTFADEWDIQARYLTHWCPVTLPLPPLRPHGHEGQVMAGKRDDEAVKEHTRAMFADMIKLADRLGIDVPKLAANELKKRKRPPCALTGKESKS